MLYEMLTWLLPFEGESLGEILMKHLTAQPNLSKVAEPYRSVIARALEKDPAKRFSNVSEMVALLPGSSRKWEGEAPAEPQANWQGNTSTVPSSLPPREAVFWNSKANAWENVPPAEPRSANTLPIAQSADLPEEPLARWVVCAWREFWRSWQHSPLPPGMRNLVGILLVGGLMFLAIFTLPLVIYAGVIYLVYYLIRSLVLSLVAGHHEANRRDQLPSAAALHVPSAGANVGAATPVLAKTADFRKPWQRPKKRLRPRPELLGTPRERARDLFGSLLLSPLVIGVLFFLGSLLNLREMPSDRLGHTAWAVCVTILGTWAALIFGKLWESHPGEPILRRFSLLVVGLLVGGCAWLLAGWLGLTFDNAPEWRELSMLDAARYGQAWDPRLTSIASFGITFGLIAWWHQCDPLRTKRFSFVMLGLSLLMAFATHVFLPFMQPWGLLIVGVMSITLQLTSRWVPTEQRHKLEVS